MARERKRRVGSAIVRGVVGLKDIVAAPVQLGRQGASKLKPKAFDRKAFYGQDRDGGVGRFKADSWHLSAANIAKALRRWERERQLFLVASSAFLALIPILLVTIGIVWGTTIGLCLAAGYCFFRSTVADFCAWQIEQGRFGAPADYLNSRLPRNMQIIEKDQP